MTQRAANPIQHWQIDPYEFDLYKGEWNAATNSPELVSESGSKGEWYRVSVGGGNYNKGDDIWFDGSNWVRRESGNGSDNSNITWISAEYRDIEAGTADSHVLLLKALYAFTITSCVMKLDDGTLEISFLKNGTEITGISAISATTTKTETPATENNEIEIDDELSISWSAVHTGNPSAIIVQLNIEIFKEIGDFNDDFNDDFTNNN